MLEIGRRRRAPLSTERVLAALIGGLVGWAINVAFHLNLIRLVVPKEPPSNFTMAVVAAVLIGGLSGMICSLAALAVNRAKKWQAPPAVRSRSAARPRSRRCWSSRGWRRPPPRWDRAAVRSCGPRAPIRSR
jgi:H+/Cl- antiporter ClcA